ncbi:MAG: DUF952 domain-containing protein [Alphaproteobacteria bacterium]|nr:DUF952 domain-containing protein [Alphaproteobacteria bacterium]
MATELIYKICTEAEWATAQRAGRFSGSAVDIADGFIHFSTGDQVAETARKHFAGQSDLVLVTIETGLLKATLKWEPSRGGALFPHLYEDLNIDAATTVQPMPLGADGAHILPETL